MPQSQVLPGEQRSVELALSIYDVKSASDPGLEEYLVCLPRSYLVAVSGGDVEVGLQLALAYEVDGEAGSVGCVVEGNVDDFSPVQLHADLYGADCGDIDVGRR